MVVGADVSTQLTLVTIASPLALDRWPWCTCLPNPAQTQLFEMEPVDVPLAWEWPLAETSCTGARRVLVSTDADRLRSAPRRRAARDLPR